MLLFWRVLCSELDKQNGLDATRGCIPSQAPAKIYNAELWLEAKTLRTTAINIDIYDNKKGGTKNMTVSSFLSPGVDEGSGTVANEALQC